MKSRYFSLFYVRKVGYKYHKSLIMIKNIHVLSLYWSLRFMDVIKSNGMAESRIESGTLFNNLISQFVRLKLSFLAMSSPLSTANPTPAILISNILANSVREIPSSRTAQKQKRLLALTFFAVCFLKKYHSLLFS